MARTTRTPKSRTKRKTKPDWAPKWLKAFEEELTVSYACQVAKVGRTTVYERRQRDEDFALAWHDIEERTTEVMEREAYRRGVEGVEKPVFQKGSCVGHVREFSDTLLIFMLKSRRPDIYRERYQIDHAGTVKHEHSFDLSRLSQEELDELERLTRAATGS